MRVDFLKKAFFILAFLGFATSGQAQTADCASDIKQVQTAMTNQKDVNVTKMVQQMLRDANDELTVEKDEAECRTIMAEAKKLLKLK